MVSRARTSLLPLPTLPKGLPTIELTRGSAVWVLSKLGFQGNVTESTFLEYIKSLRKLGIPFAPGEIGLGRTGLANYTYYHLMELALALTLRSYHVVPDPVLHGIIRYRKSLYTHYRNAYVHRCDEIGAPIVISTSGHPTVKVRGIFLDLQINHSGGSLVNFGPPIPLSPFDALTTYANAKLAARALLPINLTFLAENVVMHSLGAPQIRRGRQSPSHSKVRARS
jgi:hypothetical protein